MISGRDDTLTVTVLLHNDTEDREIDSYQATFKVADNSRLAYLDAVEAIRLVEVIQATELAKNRAKRKYTATEVKPKHNHRGISFFCPDCKPVED